MVLGRSLEEVRQVQVQFLGGCPVLPTDQAPSSMEHAPSSPGITPQEERRLCLALEWRYPRLGDVTRVQITPAERRVAEVAMGAHSRMVQANDGLVDRQSISDGRSTRQSSSSDGVTDSWRCSVQEEEEEESEGEMFPSVGPYQCEICQNITQTKQEFVTHIKTEHKGMVDKAVLQSLESDLKKRIRKEETVVQAADEACTSSKTTQGQDVVVRSARKTRKKSKGASVENVAVASICTIYDSEDEDKPKKRKAGLKGAGKIQSMFVSEYEEMAKPIKADKVPYRGSTPVGVDKQATKAARKLTPEPQKVTRKGANESEVKKLKPSAEDPIPYQGSTLSRVEKQGTKAARKLTPEPQKVPRKGAHESEVRKLKPSAEEPIPDRGSTLSGVEKQGTKAAQKLTTDQQKVTSKGAQESETKKLKPSSEDPRTKTTRTKELEKAPSIGANESLAKNPKHSEEKLAEAEAMKPKHIVEKLTENDCQNNDKRDNSGANCDAHSFNFKANIAKRYEAERNGENEVPDPQTPQEGVSIVELCSDDHKEEENALLRSSFDSSFDRLTHEMAALHGAAGSNTPWREMHDTFFGPF